MRKSTGSHIEFPLMTQLLIVVAAALNVGVTSLSAQSGSISGSVKNVSNQGISSTVVLATPSGDITAQAITDVNGSFSLTGLFDGGYRLYTLFSSLGSTSYIDELYNNQPCTLGICNVSGGTPVNVIGGGAVTGVNFVLAAAGSITGSVISGGEQKQVTLFLFDSTGQQMTFFASEPDGSYTIPGLSTGQYYLATGNEKGYIDELYPGIPCPGRSCDITAGTLISVTAPNPTTGINFSLDVGGAIVGTTRNSDGSKTLDGAQVKIYDASGTLVESRSSSFDGTYDTGTGLPSGNYFVTAEREDYVQELFSNLDCVQACSPTTGTPVVVSAPGVSSGVDFSFGPKFDLRSSVKKIKAPSKQMAKVNIFNDGLEASGPFKVKVYLSETNPKSINAKVIKELDFADLAPLSKEVISIKRRKLGQKKFLVVEVDTDLQVDEADELNNGSGKKLAK